MELPEFTDLDFAMESSGPEPVDAAAGSSPVTAGAEHDKLDAVLYAMQVGDVAAGPDTPAAAGALDVESQSHFDLGIGYKEMAMFASAIAEFDKALTGRFRIADCLTLMAQCRLAMGQVATAEANFQEALRQPELKEAGRIALRYELGLLYENSGRLLEALENFQEVADRDRLFREATGKVTALRQALGLDEQGDKSAPGPGPGGHKRISYV
jgi:tetratricopeptide (TPR) repeat protein